MDVWLYYGRARGCVDGSTELECHESQMGGGYEGWVRGRSGRGEWKVHEY